MHGYFLGAREIGPLQGLKKSLRKYAKTENLRELTLKLDKKDITLKVEGIPRDVLDSIIEEKNYPKQKIHWLGSA